MNLDYPVSKSHMAFLFAVADMYEKWPRSVYMWTFTFEKFQPDWRAMMRWDEFKTKLCGRGFGARHNSRYPLLQGLRVVEVHPGNNFHGLSHGLHFHCLFNQRVCVHWVRRVACKFGFGRIQARKVTQEEARYIGKYLTKGQPELTKGARRWGTINWPEACKVRDIKVESTFHTNIRKVQEATKSCQLSCDIIHTIFVNTRIHGEYKDWPIDKYYYSGRSEEFFNPERMQQFADPSLKPLKLLRSNRQVREESMTRQAIAWKERARRMALGHEGRHAEDRTRAYNAKQHKSAPQAEKIFRVPRGAPGVFPVLESDGARTYYVYQWDKKGEIIGGTLPA